MNKIFKTVVNKTTKQSTVASELAKGHGKLKNTFKAAVLSIALSLGLSSSSFAETNPQLDAMVQELTAIDADAAKLVQKLGNYMGDTSKKLPGNIDALFGEADALLNQEMFLAALSKRKPDLTSYKDKLNGILAEIDKANANTAETSQPSNTPSTPEASQPSNTPSAPAADNPSADLLKKMYDEINKGGLTEETRAKAQELLGKLIQTADPLVINNSGNKTVAEGKGTVSVAGATAIDDEDTQGAFSNLAVGPRSFVNKNGQVAVGVEANDNTRHLTGLTNIGYRSTSVGYRANAVDTDSVALGSNSWGIGHKSTSVGSEASAYAAGATALGSNTLAYSNYSLAIGFGAAAGIDKSSKELIELNKLYSGVDENGKQVEGSLFSLAAKHNLNEEQMYKIKSLGYGPDKYNLGMLSTDNLVARFEDFPDEIKTVLTQLNTLSKEVIKQEEKMRGAIAIGRETLSYGENSVALGNEIRTALKNSVILGNKSDGSTTATASAKSQELNGETHTFAGTPSEENGVVSVGAKDKERQIKHVAPGEISEVSTDAVNGSQLYSLFVKSNTGVGSIANKVSKLEGRIGNVEKQISHNRTEARSGIAGAAAIAGLPEIHVNGKSMVSVAASNFKNQNAIAVGYTKLNDKGNLKFKLSGAATTNSDVITTIGVGYAW
ncbi:putative yadA-like protein [Haemophilus haemolyticus M19107]|nr:putative yadA-like protein [Haemophilus haemolyticus M19107]